MKKIAFAIGEPEASVWNQLPSSCQDLVAEKAIKAILKGELYPTGTDQLDLAITLTEKGVSPSLISQITRLEPSVFEDFLS
ncbi:MAG: hypothetical protein AAF632_24460 [Bacteroidota bacterium]